MCAAGNPVAGRDGLAVLDAEEIRRALTRIAHEILERTHGGDEVILLGERCVGDSEYGGIDRANREQPVLRHLSQRIDRRRRIEMAHIGPYTGRHETLIDLDIRHVQPERWQVGVA